MHRLKHVALLSLLVCLCPPATQTFGEDWPTWRHDAGRSGASQEQLPAELHPQWKLQLAPLTPAWSEDPRLQFDAWHEPIVVGETMFLSSSANDSVSAYDLATGKRKWRFYASGAVRFAPVVVGDRVYFGADDGRFHCLEAGTGKLIWKFRAAPSDRNVIGNGRFGSVWPIRGGPVLQGDRIYFTAGVWPFEGTMFYSLDIGSGSDAPSYTSSTLNDQAPQGYLAHSDDRLFIPCGRANALVIDPASGKTQRLSYSAKGQTDFHVVSTGKWLFHGSKVVDVAGNRVLPITARRPIVSDGVAYFAAGMKAQAVDLINQDTVEKKDRRGKTVRELTPRKLWTLASRPVEKVHALAGAHLYVSYAKTLMAVDTSDSAAPKVVWTCELEDFPENVVPANGKLLVVTRGGGIHCFGAQVRDVETIVESPAPTIAEAPGQPLADEILKASDAQRGFAVVCGLQSEHLVERLIADSQLHVIAIDRDAERVRRLRTRLDRHGLYGSRCTALVGRPNETNLPPYLANLVVVEPSERDAFSSVEGLRRLYESVRPYGGTLCFLGDPDSQQTVSNLAEQARLSNAKSSRSKSLVMLRRVGALEGSADWSHEFGDPANTLMSREKLVKAPLGVLWFGGPASDGGLFFDRHEWGPSMAVVEGRMFIQGPGRFTAVDVYTGSILWQNEIAGGASPGRGSNWGPTGYHFVVAKDAIYLTFPKRCDVLDPATGEKVRELKLPESGDHWGRIRIVGQRMFVPVFRKRDGAFAPEKLLVMDRNSGNVLWSQQSDMSFPLMAIGNGKVFCYEGMLEGLYIGNSRIRVNGAPKAGPILNVKAFDIDNGEELWSRSTPRAASWVAYSEKDDVLLVSNKQGIDAWQGKNGDELWSKQAEGKGFRGHPENYWDKVIIWNGRILDQRGPGKSYDIKTGTPILTANPITDEKQPWEFTKIGHHCNYAIASEHLMTFRAASAGFLDLNTGGTSRLEGFRSGCRNSLIPANGVLNAPNFAHGCSCSYSIFTSLALVHVPETDLWSYTADQSLSGSVKRLGVNFAAPGDRRAEDRTLWLNYPNRGGPSPKINVKVSASNSQLFRLHPGQMRGSSAPWVGASGMRGVNSVTIPVQLGDEKALPRRYRIRLHFAEPDAAVDSSNVFDVAIQGKTVLEDFDVLEQAGDARTTLVRDFETTADKQVTISFQAKRGRSLINGIEVHAVE